MEPASTYRADIDGLRAVAVLLVVFYHFGAGPSGGYVGVDVFFVISGFLITQQLLMRPIKSLVDLRSFLIRRARRIVPALALTSLVTLGVGVLVMSPSTLGRVGTEAIAALSFVSNILFWQQAGYFDASALSKPLLHTWSLGVEAQFYVLWPILMALVSAVWKRSLLPVFFGASIIGIALSQVELGRSPSSAFYLLPFRVFEFTIGAIVAVAPATWRLRQIPSSLAYLAGLSLIFGPAILYSDTTRFPGLAALAPATGAALCILYGNASLIARPLKSAIATWLGRLSYSIYLVHWPVMVLTVYLMMETPPLTALPALCAATLILASLSYYFVEEPFRRRSALLGGAAPLAAIAIAPAILSTFILAGGGLPWRLSESRSGLGELDGATQMHQRYYGGVDCPVTRCETQPDQGLPTAYVVGDSHARALHQGLKTTLPHINFIVFGPDSCPFYSTTYRTHGNAYEDQCTRSQELAFEEIATTDWPILIHQHWAGRKVSPHVAENSPTLVPFESSERFSAFVLAELAAHTSFDGARNLIIVGGVPRFAEATSPYECTTRPLFTDCGNSQRSHGFISEPDIINAEMSQISGFQFIDPFHYLCDDKSCRNFTEDGMPIYSDSTHLSTWGSIELVGEMADAISEAVTGKPDL